jgi:hypothetical protein
LSGSPLIHYFDIAWYPYSDILIIGDLVTERKMSINIGSSVLGGVVVCMVLLSACGGEKPTPTPPAVSTATPAPFVVRTPTPGAIANATQGSKSPAEASSNLRPSSTSIPTNAAPEVTASARVIQAAILQLDGSALDSTLPNGKLTTRWTQVSGPSPVVFADPSRVDTTATFTTAGTYVLRLTATDGEFTVSDDLKVQVQP